MSPAWNSLLTCYVKYSMIRHSIKLSCALLIHHAFIPNSFASTISSNKKWKTAELRMFHDSSMA